MGAASTCRTCAFRAPDVHPDNDGFCVRYPPQMDRRWPRVRDDNWCGEYSALAPLTTTKEAGDE